MTADLFLAGLGQGPLALPPTIALVFQFPLRDATRGLRLEVRDPVDHDFTAIDQVPIFVDPIADL